MRCARLLAAALLLILASAVGAQAQGEGVFNPTTNASFLTSGTLPNARLSAVPNSALANSSITIAGLTISLGGTQTIACSNLSNGATGCSTATGTSGATLPLLNGTNTWSGTNTFAAVALNVASAVAGPSLSASASLLVVTGSSNGIQFNKNDNSVALMNISNTGGVTMPLLANSATTSAVCFNTGTGSLTYNSTIGTCTVSMLVAKNLHAPLDTRASYRTVMALQGWEYDLKKDLPTYTPGTQVGFVADYAAKVDPRLVAFNPDGSVAGFRYEQYAAVLTGAMQYQDERIAALEARIGSLEAH